MMLAQRKQVSGRSFGPDVKNMWPFSMPSGHCPHAVNPRFNSMCSCSIQNISDICGVVVCTCIGNTSFEPLCSVEKEHVAHGARCMSQVGHRGLELFIRLLVLGPNHCARPLELPA